MVSVNILWHFVAWPDRQGNLTSVNVIYSKVHLRINDRSNSVFVAFGGAI